MVPRDSTGRPLFSPHAKPLPHLTPRDYQEGYAVSRKRIQHAMRAMGIQGLAPGPATSRSQPAHAGYPYLLRGVTAAYPNHVWGIDIERHAALLNRE